MSDFIKPDIVEEEIILDSNKTMMSKTNKEGILEFANDYFMEISGYEEYELMGKSISCIQHPDMPEVIFKILWEKLLAKENLRILIKNIAKSGRFYWSVTNFDFKVDDQGEVLAIYSKRIGATRESIAFFEKLYKTLLKIEQKNGVEASEKYLTGFLEERHMSLFSELMTDFYGDFSSTPNIKVEPKTEVRVDIKEIKTKEIKEESIPIQLDNQTNEEVNPTKIEKLQEQPVEKEIEEKIENKPNKIAENKFEDKVAEKKLEDKVAENKLEDKGLKNNSEDKDSEIEKETAKKSLFQRMFGKTDEEIEEEKKRKSKK